MMSKTPMQAMPEPDAKGGPADDAENVGRTGGGESGGGAYKDPDLVETKPGSYQGGQSKKEYHGGGDAVAGDDNANAVTDED